jgi:hypothetical protein
MQLHGNWKNQYGSTLIIVSEVEGQIPAAHTVRAPLTLP